MARALSGKQRAALRKAQLASARARRGRKIRRRVAYAGGALAVTAAVAGGAYAGRSYVRKVALSGPRRPADTVPAGKRVALYSGPEKVTISSKKRGRKNYTGRGKGGAFKVNSKGEARFIKRISGRGKYDAKRREVYRQGKLKARR